MSQKMQISVENPGIVCEILPLAETNIRQWWMLDSISRSENTCKSPLTAEFTVVQRRPNQINSYVNIVFNVI